MKRNQKNFWYALFESDASIVDDHGYESGESSITYGNPVRCRANISPAQGEAAVRQFGEDLRYDRILVMDDPGTPIDELAVLWIDREPELNDDGTLATSENGTALTPWDYVVKGVARSLNSVSIAVSRVNVR